MGGDMREIKKIILHCSDSDFGSASLIRKWHTEERGWDDIGYHYVITNGVQTSMYPYVASDDGIIQEGRSVDITGAHVRGHNSDSIGICLIGKHHFTVKQLYEALPALIQTLLAIHELTLDNVYGHNEFDPEKTCPNFSVAMMRTFFKELVNVKPS